MFLQETCQRRFTVPGPQRVKELITTEGVRLLRLRRVRNDTWRRRRETWGEHTHERSDWPVRRHFSQRNTFALHPFARVDTRGDIPSGEQRMHLMPFSPLSTEVCAGAGLGKLQTTPYTKHFIAIITCFSRQRGISAALCTAAFFRRISGRQQAAKLSVAAAPLNLPPPTVDCKTVLSLPTTTAVPTVKQLEQPTALLLSRYRLLRIENSQELCQRPCAAPAPQRLKQQNTTEGVRLLRLRHVRNATGGSERETRGELTHERSDRAARRHFSER
ncbi:unnamed protein product [Rangifer tarandus platyrhynchus]|uniref:Uncharacterized protein n=1 Tax=Rangifer tarandus platyrhynchus TaxID=3082113 RepID=A0ACB1KGK8_RANTA